MKRILSFVLVLFSLVLLVGCSKQTKTLTVGLEAGYEPFNWTQPKQTKTNFKLADGAGFVEGYDVFVAKELAKKTGKKLIIKKIDWDGLIPALKSKSIDLIIAGMTKNEEREKEISFTSPYYSSEIVMVLKKTSPYLNKTVLSEYGNATIASQKGTIYSDISKRNFGLKSPGSKIVELDSYSDMLTHVRNNICDFFIAEYPVASNMVKNIEELTLIPLTTITDFEKLEKIPVNIGVRKDDHELREEINSVLDSISEELRQQEMNSAISLFHNEIVKKPNLFKKYALMFLKGIAITLLLSIVGTFGGLGLSFGLLSLRNLKVDKKRDNWLKKTVKYIGIGFAKGYITIVRGTPMMVQAMIVFFGLAPVLSKSFWTPLVASLFIVTFNTTAYIAEILRSGINAIDNGQMEAARSLGFTKRQASHMIIYPQALKNSLPSIGNEFIVNLKDTSVLTVIGLTDLFSVGRIVGHETYKVVGAFLVVALIYLVLTYFTSMLINYLDKRRQKGGIQNA